MADHLVSEALYLTDPDGLGIEVYADRPRSTWRMHGGRSRWRADPLDLDDLVAAGGDQPWSGMPAGTSHGSRPSLRGRPRPGGGLLPRRPGARPDPPSVSRRALHVRRRLSPPSRHQHLGRRALRWPPRAMPACWNGPSGCPDEVTSVARPASLAAAGHAIRSDGPDAVATDPWDTSVRLTAADSSLTSNEPSLSS